MTVKISELPNLEVGQLTSVSSIVPVVANLGATITTYSTSMANVKTYVETGNLSITGTLTTAGSAEFQNNVTVLGGLVVAGNITTSGSNNLIISDNIIELHVANTANISEPWTVDDGKDIGIRFHWYGTQDESAALVFSHDERAFEFYNTGALGANTFTGNSYGPIKAGEITLVNATPTTGNATGSFQTYGGAAVTGNLWVGGLSTLTGNITAPGNLALTGTATVGGRVLATGNIVTPARMSTGNLNVNTFATVGTTLVAGGNTTVAALTVNSSATVGSTLGVTGNANVSGATIAQSATIGTTLGVGSTLRAGSIQNTPIGNATAATGRFTTLTTTGIASIGADTTVTGNVNPLSSNTYTLGNLTNQWDYLYANAIQANATTALYADLAEKYVPDQYYDPGTVVVFGGEQEITVTDQQGDTRVAGAISTEPAYLMNNGEENGIPVALRGKIPVKVVGSVNKGDLLITSNVAGYATAAKFYKPDPHAVFAKSLERDDSEGARVIWAVIL